MIESEEDFKKDAAGYQARWKKEFEAAREEYRKFWEQSEKVISHFLDDRREDSSETKINLFHANVTTLKSMLYGRVPKVEVDRRHADQDDDEARVAGNILQRMLNTDIEEAGEDYSAVLRNCLDDRLLPGMGCARLKYDFESDYHIIPAQMDEEGNELAPEVKQEVITDEWVETIYVHWKDVMWSPCRTWPELRWRAYRAYMTKDQFKERFGEEAAKNIEFSEKIPNTEDGSNEFLDAMGRAEVWEIWCKDSKKVYWYCESAAKILDVKGDTLGLEGFFPEPPSMFANLTTSKLLPKADFVIAQDLYNQVNELETRIALLTRALKLAGVYDKRSEGLQALVSEAAENQLIPVDNWAMFAEKGGLKGVVDWMPIEEIAKVLALLVEQRNDSVNLLYQVTGMSDILRGASVAGASATEQAIKAKFASVRVQALQDEFARFATDLQKIKAEIIAKHFQVETILKASNITTNPVDQQLIMPAIQLIKNASASRWKIQVRSESMAMVDYAQLKQDRTEYINALGLFLQSAAPIVEFAPQATNVLLELLKWGLAGFKGSQQIEGVIDAAIAQLKQNPPGQQDDGQQQKNQMEMQKLQGEMQMQREKHQMEMQSQQQKQQHDREMLQLEMKKEMMQFRMDMQESQAKLSKEMEKIILQAKADQARAEGQVRVAEAQGRDDYAD